VSQCGYLNARAQLDFADIVGRKAIAAAYRVLDREKANSFTSKEV
jgi:hypothetical protein